MSKYKVDGINVVEDADAPDENTDDGGDFDPTDHTVDDVKAHVDANPDELDAILAAEQAGKARVTLVEWLEGYEVE